MRKPKPTNRNNIPNAVAQAPYRTGRVFSFGLFVADMIYRQRRGSDLPDEFLGIKRGRGDNAMISVPAEWIARAKDALAARGVPIDTNFGGLANAMVYILAALTPKGEISLAAPCGNDKAGRDNIASLERLGVDARALRKSILTTKISASNLIRNLEVSGYGGRGKVCHKDFAFYLEPTEGFHYAKCMPKDLKRQDIVHIGGIDLVICPGHLSRKQKQARYKSNINEMVKVAGMARKKSAVVVADFCMGDPDFWEMVPDSFFGDIDVAKPSITQALAIYNSRHRGSAIKLDLSDFRRLVKEDKPELLRVQEFLLNLGFGSIFMTLDIGGTIISAREGSVFGRVYPRHIPIIPARKFVDGTGCGDAFVAGIIYSLREGLDMFTAARFASTIGSLIAERVGVSLENRYCGRGKWLPVVRRRLKKAFKEFRGYLKRGM